METRVKRDMALDLMKLAACVGVVVIHMSGYGLRLLPQGGFDWLCCAFWDCLARFAVPVFFMCTGALMLPPARRLDPGQVFRRYFLRVLFILLFWAWVYYLYTVIGTYLFTGWLEPHFLRNSITRTLSFTHHLHLYYLQILLLVYAALPLLRVFVRAAERRELLYALGLWFALGILLPLLRFYPPFSFMGGLIDQYVIRMAWSALGYVLLGHALYTRPTQRAELPRFLLLFALGFALCFGGTLALTLATGTLDTNFMEGMSPGPALMAVGLFGALRCRCIGRESAPRLARLVRASFCVYLVHHFFVMAFRQLGLDVGLMPALLAVPLESAAVLALSLAVWWVLSRIPFVREHLI